MSKDDKEIVIGTLIDESITFSFSDICQATHTDPALMSKLVEYHILTPIGTSTEDWEFDSLSLKRAKLARNFYHDLEVNLQGIALLLDMMDTIDQLKSEIAKLK